MTEKSFSYADPIFGLPVTLDHRLYRFAFHDYINRKLGHNIEFKEMSKAVSKDGLFVSMEGYLSSTYY